MKVSERMEDKTWKPLDLVTGGILTAGIAATLYKLGKRSLHFEPGPPRRFSNQELDAMRLNECVALARLPSEMEFHFPPKQSGEMKRLADSIQQSIQEAVEATRIRKNGGHQNKESKSRIFTANTDIRAACDTFLRQQPTEVHVCKTREIDQMTQEYQQISRSPTRSPNQTSFSQPSPSDQARLLQVCQQRFDKWAAESDAKIERLERQKLELSLELRMTSETMERLRSEQADEDHNRRRTQIQFKEMENKLRRAEGLEMKLAAREAQVKQLEQHVFDLEDQLERIYVQNVVVSREAAQKRVEDFEQMQQALENLQARLDECQRDLGDMENNNDSLQIQLSKARRDLRELGVENASLQKQLLLCQTIVRELSCNLCASRRMYSRDASSPVKNLYNMECDALADALQQDQPLDILLAKLAAVLRSGLVQA